MTEELSPHPPLGVCNSHCKCYFVAGAEFCYLRSTQQLGPVSQGNVLGLHVVGAVNASVLFMFSLVSEAEEAVYIKPKAGTDHSAYIQRELYLADRWVSQYFCHRHIIRDYSTKLNM